eukprot:332946_1
MATCDCGAKLVENKLKIVCDDCNKRMSGDTIVYHCSSSCEFDLCCDCASKRKIKSTAEKLQIEEKFKQLPVIIDKISCICGKPLFKTHAKNCYHSYDKMKVVICDQCGNKDSGLMFVYHCKEGQMRLHQSGYHICIKCASSNKCSNNLLTKQQNESIDILNECELTCDLIYNIKLFIVKYCGELTGIDLINNLEFNDQVEQDLTHKKEWIKIKSKLASWNETKIISFNINNWSDCYGFNPQKKPDENRFGLGLKHIVHQNKWNGYNKDLFFHIKDSVCCSVGKELESSQSVSDMYNSKRYPQYNWCVFIHGRPKYGYGNYSMDTWTSFYIWDDDNWNRKITILQLDKQITLKHRMNNDRKFWYLKMSEYERKTRMGANIYCIVEIE